VCAIGRSVNVTPRATGAFPTHNPGNWRGSIDAHPGSIHRPRKDWDGLRRRELKLTQRHTPAEKQIKLHRTLDQPMRQMLPDPIRQVPRQTRQKVKHGSSATDYTLKAIAPNAHTPNRGVSVPNGVRPNSDCSANTQMHQSGNVALAMHEMVREKRMRDCQHPGKSENPDSATKPVLA
jgi:hypothetical protein